MIKSETNIYGLPLYILYPGDYYASEESCIIETITGACVVVCLFDYIHSIGGMGHFIVPGTIGTEGIIADEIAKQGILSMEFLMAEIVKLGGDRRYVRAKLFGAGYITSSIPEMGGIVDSNIRFMHEYFSMERIEVETEDLGGNYRRKIMYLPLKGQAYRKLLTNNNEASEFMKLEKEYIDNKFNNKERYGKLILFE
ncbi:MAG: chemotaxis protein CheD [Spirochaetota bacterium]|nr:chemotaxis protein CheD [Spirochaetota bacterium]